MRTLKRERITARIRVPRRKITNAERIRIAFKATLRAARIERKWYKDQPMMTAQEIQSAISTGRLINVIEQTNLFRIARPTAENPNAGVQYAVLTPKSASLLNQIAREFSKRCNARSLESRFLNITSMTRDAQRQKKLRDAGYPAAEVSTHGIGEAFDINVRYFLDLEKTTKRKDLHLRTLRGILRELHVQGKINLIDETKINGALHVARNPNGR